MIPYLSERVRSLAPSRTIAMNQRARQLKESGIDVIDLSVGEPDFPTPEPIREAAKLAIDSGYTFYTPVAGYPELRAAASRKLLRENGLRYPPESILVSCGAKHCIANAVLTLVDPGDEVIVPAPYWVSYVELVRLAGGVPVVVPTRAEDDYKLDPEALGRAIGPRTKALILCSPSNPAGSVYSRVELAGLASELRSSERVWVISDEIYEHINFVGGHESIASFPELAGRVVVVNGVSKAYAMTGWRIGYMAGPAELVGACTTLQGQMTTNASSIAQRAAIAALDSDPSVTADMKEAFRRRRDLVTGLMREIPELSFIEPEGAFYVFPDVSALFGRTLGGKEIRGSDDVAAFFLEEARVATVPGSAFGDDRCVRISFATADERLIVAFSRIASSLRPKS